jgi:hypothetical protein
MTSHLAALGTGSKMPSDFLGSELFGTLCGAIVFAIAFAAIFVATR